MFASGAIVLALRDKMRRRHVAAAYPTVANFLNGNSKLVALGIILIAPSRPSPSRAWLRDEHSRKQSSLPRALSLARPVGFALYGRSNRKLVGSPEVVSLRSAPPTSGVVNI
eukprot:6211738-Pleurochrysis_carterae.AAC.3